MKRILNPAGDEREFKRSRTIVSTGRGQPCAPQGLCVSNIILAKDEFTKRTAEAVSEAELIAPIGSQAAFHSVKGELGYILTDDFGQNERERLDKDGNPHVITHVGGLSKKQKIKGGIYIQYAPGKDSSDEVGTGTHAGTVTVINTGPYELVAGDHFYFSKFPYVTQDPVTGRVAPAIREIGNPDGDPNECISSEKYRPALYPVRDDTVVESLRRCELKMDEWVKTKANVITSEELDEFVKKTYFQHSEDHPIREYAKLYAVFKAHNRKRGDAKTHLAALKTLRVFFAGKKEGREKYDDAVLKKLEFKHPVLNATYMEGTDTLDIDGIFAGSAGLEQLFYPVLAEWLFEALSLAQADIQNFFRSHILGKVIRGGAPGRPFDALLGYFHN